MQGNAACFQVVCHKNLDTFNRRIFVGQTSLGGLGALDKERLPAPATNGTAHAE
jgi:hypothetical protein